MSHAKPRRFLPLIADVFDWRRGRYQSYCYIILACACGLSGADSSDEDHGLLLDTLGEAKEGSRWELREIGLTLRTDTTATITA